MRLTDQSEPGRPSRALGIPGAATGVAAGALAIAAVTLLIGVLKQVMDPSALTGLYLFAILPIAIGWGFWPAGVAALASYLTFQFFFVPPIHSFAIADGGAAAALLIAIATAYVVSELARRAHGRAQDARARAREAEEAQASQRRLAEEQAALRRVATLVALRASRRARSSRPSRARWVCCAALTLRGWSASRPTLPSRRSRPGHGTPGLSLPSGPASPSRG